MMVNKSLVVVVAAGWLATVVAASACSGGADPASVSGPKDEVWFPTNPSGGNPFESGSSGSGCVPVTCAQLGLTCGQASDGCGGTLDCDNGSQDGTETDIDCGGGCEPCLQGQQCATGSDCQSGFCADMVCCDQACDQTCETCAAGACQPVFQGDPDDDTCPGPTQACDGAGNCLLASGEPCFSDTECASGFCDTTTATCF